MMFIYCNWVSTRWQWSVFKVVMDGMGLETWCVSVSKSTTSQWRVGSVKVTIARFRSFAFGNVHRKLRLGMKMLRKASGCV